MQTKENYLKSLFEKANNLCLTSAEREMLLAEARKSSLKNILECVNVEMFSHDLAVIYHEKFLQASRKLSRKPLAELLERYHKRRGNLHLLAKVIVKKIQEEDPQELMFLAQKYNIPGIQEKMIERIRCVYQ